MIVALTMAAPPLTMWQAAECIEYVEQNLEAYQYQANRNVALARDLAWDDCEAHKRFETWSKAHPRVEYGGPR